MRRLAEHECVHALRVLVDAKPLLQRMRAGAVSQAVLPTGGIAFADRPRELLINDFMTKDGHVQSDGSLVRDMYLFEVKKPSESNSEWDLYKLVREIPGSVAYNRPGGNACPLVKGQ
jgi:hypothetical protein